MGFLMETIPSASLFVLDCVKCDYPTGYDFSITWFGNDSNKDKLEHVDGEVTFYVDGKKEIIPFDYKWKERLLAYVYEVICKNIDPKNRLGWPYGKAFIFPQLFYSIDSFNDTIYIVPLVTYRESLQNLVHNTHPGIVQEAFTLLSTLDKGNKIGLYTTKGVDVLYPVSWDDVSTCSYIPKLQDETVLGLEKDLRRVLSELKVSAHGEPLFDPRYLDCVKIKVLESVPENWS